jgi:hypothetical protein
MGLLRAVGRTAVVAGTATAVSTARRAARPIVGRRREEQHARSGAPAGCRTAAPSEDGAIAQIEKLGELKEKGLLTEEEFSRRRRSCSAACGVALGERR